MSKHPLHKALIPVAGRAKRMRPISRAVPKALLPLIDSTGRVRPIIHFIAAEAVRAGIRQVVLVVPPGEQQTFEEYFAAARNCGDIDVPSSLACIPAEPKGFGHAVRRAKKAIGAEPFLLMLGDHVRLAQPSYPAPAEQLATAYASHGGAAMVGVQTVSEEMLQFVGIARGEPLGRDLYRCTGFAEKPSPPWAQRALRTPGLSEGEYLAHAGIYIFTAEIFDCLDEVAASLPSEAELELADAQSLLLSRHPLDYYLYRLVGRTLDTGNPTGYARAIQAVRQG